MKYLTLLVILLLYSCQWSPAFAAVPADAKQYQRELTRNSRAIFGLDAPVSLFAAQIHQESSWQVNAKSMLVRKVWRSLCQLHQNGSPAFTLNRLAII